ncbi:hypothetical protein ACJIZ3_020256 [Penstemon smallii]|uniref:Gag1-like clamp domain-containing protein n=1 Tax=Penstemon smallii TaxID=265156 RepID=A0ABD3SIU5_9LAMI
MENSNKLRIHMCDAPHGSIKPTKFVNNGLLLWNHGRRKWIRNKKPQSSAKQLLHEPKIRRLSVCMAKKIWLCNWNDNNMTYDRLLCSKKPFRKPIPLSEMVVFLVDIWEEEGMY